MPKIYRIRKKHWIDKDWGPRRVFRRGPQPPPPRLDDDPPLHRWLVRRGLRQRVTCQFVGQLGNQLYEIAATISHAHRIGGYAFIPDWAYRRVFNCRIPTGLSTEGLEVFRESIRDYGPIPPRGELILKGNFQSLSHMDEALVRKTIRFHPHIVRYVRHRYRDLLKRRTTSIHVRRGDTLAPDNLMRVLPPDYYDRAIERFPDTEVFVVFSDDIPWCRDRFRGPRFHFISGEENFVDMCTMSLCGNHIIPNSTFSWWGAWLNPDPDKRVVAPGIWYKPGGAFAEVPDRLPPEWSVLE